MNNVIPLSGQSTRCGECRYHHDCPLTDESGKRVDTGVNSRVRVAHDQDRIHRSGEAVDAVYRLRSGSVKTLLTDRDGVEQVTGFYGPGDWLGLDALHGSRHRSDSVALDTVSVCVIPVSHLYALMKDSPRANHLMIGALSDRVMRKDAMHLSLARDNAAERLAGFLDDLCSRRERGGLDGDHVDLPMSRGDIASYLALAVETVSRLLTKMQRSGLMKVHRSHLEILDRAGLAALADAGESAEIRESTACRH